VTQRAVSSQSTNSLSGSRDPGGFPSGGRPWSRTVGRERADVPGLPTAKINSISHMSVTPFSAHHRADVNLLAPRPLPPPSHRYRHRATPPPPIREQLRSVLDSMLAEHAGRIRDLGAERQTFRAKLDERQRLVRPGEDLSWDGLGEALPSWRASRRDPILQPPKPQITPSARILRPAAERDAEPEAPDLRRRCGRAGWIDPRTASLAGCRSALRMVLLGA
jgi:hypothetical protein